MTGSAIREFAVSRDGHLLVAGCQDVQVEVWDLHQWEKMAALRTVFLSGAAMLAIPPGGEFVIAGSSRTGELACYRVSDGRVIWQRKLAWQPSGLRYSGSGDRLWCGVDRRSAAVVIDASDGEILESIPSVEQYWANSYGQTFSIPLGGSTYLLTNPRSEAITVERLTFALLDTAFAPDSFCLAEACGPVRCIDSSNGRLRWRFDPERGSHVLFLHYSEHAGCYYGVLWQHDDGLFRRLVRFSPDAGEVTIVRELDSWEDVFVPRTDQLVTSRGHVIDLATGKTVAKLGFPLRRYPDVV